MNTSYFEIALAFLILLLPFLYETSGRFRFHLKFAFYYVSVSCKAILLIPVFTLRAKNVRNLVIASWFCSYLSPILGMKWIIRGKEHLKEERACIIVCNHQSSLDIIGMFKIWPIMDKCTVVAKKEILYVWPFGMAAWLCGLIFIDRMNTNKARLTMEQAAEDIKKKKTKLWVFPEGKRHNTGQIHSFKKGAFHLAISSQLPILPIVYSRYYFLDEQNTRFDHGRIIITTLPAIPTAGLKAEDVDMLIEKTHQAMSMTFDDTSQEVAHICSIVRATYCSEL